MKNLKNKISIGPECFVRFKDEFYSYSSCFDFKEYKDLSSKDIEVFREMKARKLFIFMNDYLRLLYSINYDITGEISRSMIFRNNY